MYNYTRRLFHELTHPRKAALDGSLSGPSTILMVILCETLLSIFTKNQILIKHYKILQLKSAVIARKQRINLTKFANPRHELLTVHLHRIQQIAMLLSTYLSVLPLANHPATRTTSKPKSFLSVPPSLPFIQILRVDGCHWITESNIDILNGSQRSDSVMICDQTHWILIWLMSTLNQMVGIVVCLQ